VRSFQKYCMKSSDANRILSSPFKDIARFLGALLLVMFSFLIIPGAMLLGYMVRVAQSEKKRSKTLPELNNWKELAITGFKVFGILLFWYVIILLINIILGLIGTSNRLISLGALAISLVLSASLPLFVNVSIVRLAVKKNFFKALTIREVVADLRKKLSQYVLLIAMFLILTAVLQAIIGLWILTTLTLVNLLVFIVLIIFIGTYSQIIIVKLFARIYYDT